MAGFEFLVREERIGRRRVLRAADTDFLKGVTARYARAVRTGSGDDALYMLGRELFAWLDADRGQLRDVINQAPRPFWLA
ncbi:MAG TPA: hypothetical protein VFX16_04160 [Pseudonocardiaceae bacterium]|nr:hypothetical protein [Pseudonocardiaceae bacterium]